MEYEVGMTVVTRKKHPCGSDRWTVLYVGADFRLQCLGCGRTVLLPRAKAIKRIKGVELE